MYEFQYHDNILTAESVDLRTVCERFGTPLYVYSKRSLLDHCRIIEKAFQGRDHAIHYAVKANANRAILRLIAGEGFGADIGSKGELYLALESGFRPDTITFSGVGKRDDEIRYALAKGIAAFNVESREEIVVLSGLAASMGTTARILLRVNLNIDAGGHAYISTSLRKNKFGIPEEQAAGLLRWAAGLPGIEVRGIHSHIGSQITNADTFCRTAQSLKTLITGLRATGISVTDLDFGGGFGVQYRGYVTHPDLPAEAPEAIGLSAATLIGGVTPLLEETGCRLSIQPGRSIVAHAGVLLVRVVYRKETEEKVFIIVDGGMNDLMRPSLYNSYHQIVPLTLKKAPHETVDVVGPLCESGDFFAHDRPLPHVGRGDLLALMGAGAYGYVLSSNYNGRPRPAEVLVDGEHCTLIRERETVEQL